MNFSFVTQLCCVALCFLGISVAHGQDTFSIVAVDENTGEVGSAGASCVDLVAIGFPSDHFLGELFPGVGAINTQASYLPANQALARNRMNAGDTPEQIINFLKANDAEGNNTVRQYGVVRLVGDTAQAAAFTGQNTMNYKNHITGYNYSIQGNILLGQEVLDSMEARFLREEGDLACKLMAALQGANMVGADSRCSANGTSSLFAFVKVAKPNDTFGNPSFLVSVRTRSNARIEPIDSLQSIFNAQKNCSSVGINTGVALPTVTISPNPSSGKFKVVTDYKGRGMYRVYDLSGRTISTGKIDDTFHINLNDQTSGIYLFRLEFEHHTAVYKLIKE